MNALEFSFKEEYFPDDLFKELTDKLEQSGQLKMSLFYSEQARIIQRRIYNDQLQKTITSYKARLDLRTTDEEISRTRELNSFILKRIKTERIINLSMGMISLVLILILSALSYNLLRIRKTQKALNQKNTDLNSAYNKNINYKETTLAIKENKNTFFSIISNKLAVPFAELNTRLIKLSKEAKTSFNKDGFIAGIYVSYDIATNLEKNLKQLLLWSKLQRDKYSIHTEDIHVNDYLHDLLPEFLHMSVQKNIKISFDIEPDLRIRYDKKSLRSILKVFIENSVDNSDKGAEIIIRAKKTGKETYISVTDFGSGIPASIQNKIFDMDNAGDSTPANKTRNKLGLGLLLSKNLAELNQSILKFESKEKMGTSFYIQIKN